MSKEHWYVVRCNIKSEDKAEENLRRLGFKTYAPWQKFERFNTRKKVWLHWELRLAPRYVFLNTGDVPREQTPWGLIRDCDGVEKVLDYLGLPMPLSAADVNALRSIMDAEANHEFDETRAGKLHRREIGKNKRETTRMRFPVGSKITIKDGPFASFSGEVTNVNGRGHVQALVGILGRLVSTELSTKDIAPEVKAA